jgi:MFS family permease
LIDEYPRCSTAFQPLYAQTANISGRRYLTILAVTLFTLGSGISGGAINPGMLIIGRAIQGIGGGGINTMTDIVVCDLVPLRERGLFMSVLFAVFAVGTSIGPWVGGILVTNTTWRWVFYLNIPIGSVGLVLLIAFLQVSHKKEFTLIEKLKRAEFVGNAVLMASVVSILFAVTYGGTRYSWSSLLIVVPLVLGGLGMVAFHTYEGSRYYVEPTIPWKLFQSRTSASAFTISFLHAMLALWVIYMLPLYFQAALGSTASRSGVQLLPTVTTLLCLAAVSGVFVTTTGRYKPVHLIGTVLMTLGFGLFTLMNATSSPAQWIIFQIIFATGAGIMLPTLLPAVQADLQESDTATATGTWNFIRSFGVIGGISIPTTIFNNQFDRLSSLIRNPAVRASLSHGRAYSHVSRDFIKSFPNPLRDEIIGAYSESIKLVWQVAISFTGLTFLLVFLEMEIKLRTELETEYGRKEKPSKLPLATE